MRRSAIVACHADVGHAQGFDRGLGLLIERRDVEHPLGALGDQVRRQESDPQTRNQQPLDDDVGHGGSVAGQGRLREQLEAV